MLVWTGKKIELTTG